MFNLENKVALITGSQQGMGKAHAIALSKQGAKIVVTDIDTELCDLVVEEIKKDGGDAVCYKMDVSNVSEINKVFDKVVEKFGRVDILVNNAGIYQPKPAMEVSEEEWDRMMNINLKGQFFCAQRAAEEMSKNKWGRIINIASIASGGVGVGIAGGTHYAATKGGIVGMTESLAIEFADMGINVNCIGPGAIDTPMISDAGMDDKALQGLVASLPLKRIGKSEEISAAVVFLASEEASYVTGATLYVDGGWLAA